jgi:hypothetical protein
MICGSTRKNPVSSPANFWYSALTRIPAAWEEFLPEFDLRPLSLGEILDRTFTLYRKNFLLFFGIAAIPQILTLPVLLTVLYLQPQRVPGANPFAIFTDPTVLIGSLVEFLVGVVAYIFCQGASTLGVSEIYLGRQFTIGSALGKIRERFLSLLAVVGLNLLVILGCTLLLVIPGIYMTCRLSTCVPTAVIEEKEARESLSRSFRLTKGFAGRAFMIYVVYCVIILVVGFVFDLPFTVMIAAAAGNPGMVRFWTAVMQVSAQIGGALALPVLLIGVSIFYYDLRVRKEAFDIQLMMNPELNPPSTASIA